MLHEPIRNQHEADTQMKLKTTIMLLTLTFFFAPLSLAGTLHDDRETHLSEVRQLTFGGENAEAYWSPDGSELVFQRTFGEHACDQIFRLPISDPAALKLVSTGTGRTTCAYFNAEGNRIIFSSTHATSEECPAVPSPAQGYVWPIYQDYQIYSAALDGSDLKALRIPSSTTRRRRSAPSMDRSYSRRRATVISTCTVWTPTDRMSKG